MEELAQIREPGIFIVDDVAFIQAEHDMVLGEAIAQRGIRKRYYLETRGDVALLRNKEVFTFWKRLGLATMFLGLEAIDEEGLKRFRKRVSLSRRISRHWNSRARSALQSRSISLPIFVDHERFQHRARLVPGNSGSRQYQYYHPLPWHRNMAHRIASSDHARLPAIRYPACRAAH